MTRIAWIFFAGFLFVSCKPKDKYVDVFTSEFNFALEGPIDIYVAQGTSSASHEFSFVTLSGDPDNLSLSASVDASIATCNFTQTSGKPPFKTILNIALNTSLPTGVYPMRITASSEKGGIKVYQINVQVNGAADCGIAQAGYYKQLTNTLDSSDRGKAKVFPVANADDEIAIYNFMGLGDTNYAYVDCATRTFILPNVNSLSYTNVYGYGSFDDTSITLYFRRTYDTTQFIARLSKQ